LLGSKLDGPALGHALHSVNPAWVVAAWLTYVLSQGISARRWWILLRAGGVNVSWERCLRSYFEGSFVSLCLPTAIGGDVVKALRVADSTEQKMLAAGGVLADRLAGLSALLGLGCGAAMAGWGQASWLLSLLSGILVTGFMVAALRIGSRLALRLAHHQRFADHTRFGAKLAELAARLRPYRAYENFVPAVLWSVPVQVLNIVSVGMLGCGLHLPAPAVAYGLAVPVVSLATVLPLSINGVGVREGGFLLLLGPYGVSPAESVALGLLVLMMVCASGLLGGLAFLLPGKDAPAAGVAAPVLTGEFREGNG